MHLPNHGLSGKITLLIKQQTDQLTT